jgi:hypothetical protein
MGWEEIARRKWQRAFNKKQDTIKRNRGILGNGSGVVVVPDRPDYRYVRLNADAKKVEAVLGHPLVPDVDGLPVILKQEPDSQLWELEKVDRGALSQVGSGWNVPLLGTHHASHEWEDFMPGPDTVSMFPRALTALRTEPTATYSMDIVVRPIRYSYEGVSKKYKGGQYSLTSYVPAVGQRYVLTYLDVRDGTLKTLTGNPTTYSIALDPTPPRIPWYAKPSALIKLRQNQNIVTETDIEDARLVVDDEGIVHNLTAQRAPLVSDDATLGYGPGSLWINSDSGIAYICLNGAINQAEWKQSGGGGAGAIPDGQCAINGTLYASWALAYAAASPGDTIWFGAGTFDISGEDVSGLKLVGAGIDITILLITDDDIGLEIGAAGLTYIENLTIRNDHDGGIIHDPVFCLKITENTASAETILFRVRMRQTSSDAATTSACIWTDSAGSGTYVRLTECDLSSQIGAGFLQQNANDDIGISDSEISGPEGDLDYTADVLVENVKFAGDNPVNSGGQLYGSEIKTDGGLAIHAGGLAADTNIITPQVTEAGGFDFALVDAANASGVASHFRSTASGAPSGWTEVDADSNASTALLTQYSYWFFGGGDASWKYRKKSNISLESIPANTWASFQFGPIYWRDDGFANDIHFRFGVYRDNAAAGAIDEHTYVRLDLYWNSGSAIWQIRGEEKDGTTAHASAYITLSSTPLVQPLYFRVAIQNTAAKTTRSKYGSAYIPRSHQRVFFQNPTAAPTWGNLWIQLEMAQTGNQFCQLYLGAIDYVGNVS